ncbi:MAG: restriction endonuclease subunit S [Lachnospiraceae bacterium]|nr:restriction endonuclease subunit S [Lachnospiraceae bacterium]
MKEMKRSGYNYLGSIPSNWNLQKGKFVYRITTGKLDANAEEADGKYPFFTCSNTPKWINTFAFDCEALLVAGNGQVGFTQYYNGKFNAYQRTYVLSDFNYVQPGFLKYYVSALLSEYVADITVGSVIDFIKLDYLKDFIVAIPPEEEQKNITRYLDNACSNIDETIKRHQAIIEKITEYRMAVTISAVTKGIYNDLVNDSGEEWLGDIPKHWKVQRNRTLFEETNERGNDQLPILMVSINSGISDKEIPDEERTRSVKRSEDKSKYKRMLPGDLVYNMMRAWQGAFGAARVEGMVSPAYVTLRPIVELDSRYYEYLMRTDIAAQEFKKYSRGIRDFRLRLYYPEFRDIKVCVPPVEEQREIADYLDRLYEQTETAIKQKQLLIEKLEEYRKSIIYHAVTGKIDCREVSE